MDEALPVEALATGDLAPGEGAGGVVWVVAEDFEGGEQGDAFAEDDEAALEEAESHHGDLEEEAGGYALEGDGDLAEKRPCGVRATAAAARGSFARRNEGGGIDHAVGGQAALDEVGDLRGDVPVVDVPGGLGEVDGDGGEAVDKGGILVGGVHVGDGGAELLRGDDWIEGVDDGLVVGEHAEEEVKGVA